MTIDETLNDLIKEYGFTLSETEHTLTLRKGFITKSFGGCDRHWLACRYLRDFFGGMALD